MPNTFTVDLGGRAIECRLPLFRVCLYAAGAYNAMRPKHEFPEDGPPIVVSEGKPEELECTLSAMLAICLPTSTGRPSRPLGTVSSAQWVAYGDTVDRWVWSKRRDWLADDQWSKAIAVALDAVLDVVLPVMAESEAEDTAVPFEETAADSSDG